MSTPLRERPVRERTPVREREAAAQPKKEGKWFEKPTPPITEWAPQIPQVIEKGARLGSQTAIGAALAKLFMSPAGVPLLLQALATPGAARGEILEEEFFRRELPESLRQALDLPEFKPEVAKQIQEKLLPYLRPETLLEAPFKASGVDITPQTPWEKGARTVGELESVLRNIPEFGKAIGQQFLESPAGRFITRTPEKKAIRGAEETFFDEETPRRLVPLAEEAARAERYPLSTRITTEAPKVDIRPREITRASGEINKELQPLQEHVGRKVSTESFKNEFQGGRKQIESVQKVADTMRNDVRESYSKAQQAYENISDVYPELVSKMEGFLDDFLAGRDRELLNTAEKNVVDSVEKLLNFLRSPGGFIERPVSSLLKTADSWSSKLNHEDIFGDVRRLLGELIPDVNSAALASVERKGADPSLLKRADKEYAEWAKRFGRDEIAPFLKRDILNPEELFRSSVRDEGTFRALSESLKGTPQSSIIDKTTARHIAENRLGKFFDKLENVGSREYKEEIANLEPLIGKEASQKVDTEMRKLAIVRRPEAMKEFIDLRAAERQTGFTSEQIIDKFKSSTGIKELKEKLSKTPGQKELFEKLKPAAIKDIVQGGRIKATMTGKEWFDVLNKRENFEILSELYGEKTATNFLEVFEKIGKKQVTRDNIKKVGKEFLKLKAFKYLLPLI